jgi:hypothetical protein
VTQPAGAGSPIYVYDDAFSASGLGYTFAEIAAAFPADFVLAGPLTYLPTVDLQVGDVGAGAATTTLVDTVGSYVKWAATKTLKNRGTQTTSWKFSTGTKVGSGDQASGVTGTVLVFGAATALVGTHFHYGSTFRQTVGAMQFNPSVNGTGEMCNCILQSAAAGTAPINVGSSANRFGNLYNVDISHTTAVQVMANFFSLKADRISIGGATPTTFIASGSASLTAKDLALFGSPTQSDLRWSGAGSVLWALYRPTWTGNAPKFTAATVGNPNITGATVEYRTGVWKIVDRTGAGVSGIPVELTDVLGNVIFSGTTDSAGEVSYGSGISLNMVPVMDHYVVGATTVYTQRHRSPFTFKANTSDLVGYNSLYLSRSYAFNWPGYESVTTSAGQFEDVGDIVAIEDPIPAGPGWVEMSVDV